MKKKIYKLFFILMVSLALGSGPAAQNEIRKLIEALSRTVVTQVQELDEEESDEIKKKKELQNYFQDIV